MTTTGPIDGSRSVAVKHNSSRPRTKGAAVVGPVTSNR